MEEREIDLVSLFFHILLHWRSLLVAGLIGVVLAGGYGFFSASGLNKTADEETDEKAEEPSKADELAELLELDDENMNVYMMTEKSYNDMLAYLDSLEYMKLDGENVAKTVVTVGIKSDKKEDTDAIAAVYRRGILDGGYSDFVAGKSTLSAADMELFVVASYSSSTTPNQMYDPGEEPLGYKWSILIVTTLGRTEEESEELANMAIDFIKAEKASVDRDLGEHELLLLNKDTRTGADISVITTQNDKLKVLYTLYDEMTKRKKLLSEDQLRALALGEDWTSVSADNTEIVSEDVVTDDPTQDISMSAAERLRFSLKYILIGLCGGIFCMAGLWSFLYVVNNRIKSEDPIEKLFKVAVIGVIPSIYENKRVFGFVDKWIISLRDRNKRVFSVDEAISLIVSRVKIQSSKDKVSKLVFVGCDLGKNVPVIPESMAEKLNSADINTSVLDNVLYDPENNEKLGKMDGAVIIEKAGKTLYSELTEEIELLKRQQIRLLGCVIVE